MSSRAGEILRISRSLAVCAENPCVARLSDISLDVAKLTAEADPDSIDAQSVEYGYGAALVLSAILTALLESEKISSALRYERKCGTPPP